MNGGILVQDCNNHAIGYTHSITDGTYTYEITSTHHQMQYPFTIDKNDYDILYTTKASRSEYYDGDGVDSNKIYKFGEPEIVYYHVPDKPKCLAIQGHPEIMRSDAPVIEMLNELLDTICNTNL